MVATARRIVEEEGVDALSMRRVAKELGSTPMALYHYVQDKDELLMLTLSGTAAAFPRPHLPEDPRERLLAVAVHMHDILSRIPWVLDILALGELTDRNALWMVEEIIDSAITCGLSPPRRYARTGRSGATSTATWSSAGRPGAARTIRRTGAGSPRW